MVIFEAFAHEQDLNTAESVVHAVLDDLFDPHLQSAAVGSNTLVAVYGAIQLHGLAT